MVHLQKSVGIRPGEKIDLGLGSIALGRGDPYPFNHAYSTPILKRGVRGRKKMPFGGGSINRTKSK